MYALLVVLQADDQRTDPAFAIQTRAGLPIVPGPATHAILTQLKAGEPGYQAELRQFECFWYMVHA